MAAFVTSDGLHLYFEDDGDGPAVLCLAGLTRNSRDFDYLAQHLSGVRLIRMDYRGRGQSEYDPDHTNYSIMREAQDAIELLDHLGLQKVTLIGTSRGGLIAMALATTHLDRLNGVVLNDIGPEVASSGIARIMDYVGREPDFANLELAAQALANGHAAGFPDVPLSRWREQAEFMWRNKPEGGVGLRYDANLRKALTGQAGTGAPDLWGLFDQLANIPTGVLRGENSDLLSRETLEKMRARHPGLVAATIPNRGHVPFLDEPQSLSVINQILEQAK